MDYSEKRKYKRIKRLFTTRIRPYQVNAEEETQAKWDIVTIKDFSAGGMSFNYTKKIPVGTVLEFKIALPFAQEPIYSLGQVARIDENKSDLMRTPKIPVHKVAACFSGMDALQKQEIVKYIDKF